MDRKILLIYTGGTIGMKANPKTKLLEPFDFTQIMEEVPELRNFEFHIDTVSFDPLIDSSDAQPAFWIKLAEMIRDNYAGYCGFVILHGTDTMAYTASALSFMLENLEKPVILTGSQLPIGMLRTDGKENLIDSLELAAARDPEGRPYVSEVCIYFETELFRGNRTTKFSAEAFRAFHSANYPVLAEVGTHIRYNRAALYRPKEWGRPLLLHTRLDTRVAILKMFPGITEPYVRSVLSTDNLRAVVLETYGSGNAPSFPWFLKALSDFTSSGGIVVNVTQCQTGNVDMGTYANGDTLRQAGVVCGGDMTTEAAVTKLFVLLGQYSDNKTVGIKLEIDASGEISKK
ncbi:MAG: asparaginase [Bacteroidales bacterium]|nr:asparaginase [Bacteroidales bacterium]